jgi:hypothetical protein
MADRSRVGFQTKSDTLVLQVGGWALGLHPNPIKTYSIVLFVEKIYNGNTKWESGGQGSSEMEEDCTASQGPQRTVGLEEEEEKKKKWYA